MNPSLASLLICLALSIGYAIGHERGLRAGWRDAEAVWRRPRETEEPQP